MDRGNGEALYGKVDRIDTLDWPVTGNWTRKGNTAYYWCHRWPGEELVIGGLQTRLAKASFLATGKPIKFKQTRDQLKLVGLPRSCPDKIANVCIIKLEFRSPPRQRLGAGCVLIDDRRF